ncbi:MAG: hypothetical protein A2266_01885 [Bacteroidetes bacterium RIFOXYA12_FULL_40_10]|nr:MAG: hypothetical protein A2266_01885 [Bacteroidetes bacterium RIFOXYA12_FULL_40_10]
MKRSNLYILLLLPVVVACVKMPGGSGETPPKSFEEMTISPDFNWKTSKDIKLSIYSDLTSIIKITSLDGKISYHKGLNNRSPENYLVTITVPADVKAVLINGKEFKIDSAELSVVLSARGESATENNFFAAQAAAVPLGYWNFDESSGTTAFDSFGSNNGTIANATRTPGIKGGALYFNGTSGNVNIASTPQLSPADAITMMTWVFSEENRTAKIFQKGDWDGPGLRQDVWKGWSCGIRMDNDTGHSLEWNNGRPILNEWYHLAMTYDGSLLAFYVNGRLWESKPVTGKLKVNSRNISIGSDNAVQKFFKGKIDEVFLYGSALSAQEIQSVVQSVSNPDSDGDGIPNEDDAYPADAGMAFENYYPSSGYGTLAFEDMWPSKGDYDFNDLVIDYRFKIITDASNYVSAVSCSFIVKAIGAAYANGFGFQLNSPSFDVSDIQVSGGVLEQGQNLPTFIVFNNASSLMSSTGSFGVNVKKGEPYVQPAVIEMNISFTPHKYTLNNLNISGFNPFIFVNGNRGREVHLPDYPPTSRASAALFGTGADNSSSGIGRYYKTAENLPWAINIISGFEHVIERVEITDAYLKFSLWAQSAGVQYPDWYLNRAGYRLAHNIY